MDKLAEFVKRHLLAISFLGVIFLFVTSGILTVRGVFDIGQLTRTIHQHPLVVSNAALNAGIEITKMHRSMKDVVLSKNSEEMKASLEIVSENEKRVYEQLDLIRVNILGQHGKRLEKQTRELFINWKSIRSEVVQEMESGNKERAIRITQAKGADHVALLERKMIELTSYARSKADSFLTLAERRQEHLERLSITVMLFGILISMIIGAFATYRIRLTEKQLMAEKENLEDALHEIKTLQGIIPICSFCKSIRDDKGSWSLLEDYIHKHSDARFSHGICPECLAEHYPDQAKQLSAKKKHSG